MGGSSTFFMASSIEVLENDLWVKHTYRPLLHCIPRNKQQYVVVPRYSEGFR